MTTTAPKHVPDLQWVGAFVDERVREIQYGYLQDRSDAVATLAQLRRGAGKTVAEVPELWGLTLDDRFYTRAPRVPDADTGGDPAEEAAHVALTLYGVHQQSRREDRMHQRGRDLGGAVRRLMPPGDIDEPVRRRFVQAGTAHDLPSLAYRLREIVVLLRREAVALDYGLLADRIHRFQQPGGRTTVRAAWGRAFHAASAAAVPADASAPPDDTTPETDEDHA
ncbi:type I-E CRISPR-associated protein Cse2/CasB [Streptomonospora salina]|uniref:CRISPR system Cascade subunit CasB n=1 Tax=Streptomonospora salina TaxID=104205 RepID=A0A841E4L3_9ACTN|nr:type I-E CRISPR-associated protein Cse2/CasB [Streptomonospora salina]MBB5998797.1 CRISPR system Cascade subunit CasB [Streptomonospora salina]